MSKFKKMTLLIRRCAGSSGNTILMLFSAIKNSNILLNNGGNKIAFLN